MAVNNVSARELTNARELVQNDVAVEKIKPNRGGVQYCCGHPLAWGLRRLFLLYAYLLSLVGGGGSTAVSPS